MMKKCPFCGADIEDNARFCLYCMQSLVEKEQIFPKSRKKPQWLLILASIVALLLALALAVFLMQAAQKTGPSSDDSQPSTTMSTQTEPSDTQPVTEPSTQPSTEPHTHSFTVQNTANAYRKADADCLHPAAYYYSCACGETGSTTFYDGEAKGHSVVTDPGSPASCVTSGLTEGQHCFACGAVFLAQTSIPVTGHTFDSDLDETCNVCNYIRARDCTHTQTVKLAAVSPTCTASGLTEGKACALCEEILTPQDILAPFGHKEVIDQAITATCTTDGRTEGKHCSVCLVILVQQQYVSASGHAFSDEDPSAPCSRCGAQSPNHEHSFTQQNTDEKYLKATPDCDDPYLYYYSCVCGEKGWEVFHYGKSKGHTVVVEPGLPAGCTTQGTTDLEYCSTCGEIFELHLPVLPLGHTYEIGGASACEVCGEPEPYTIIAPQLPIVVNNQFDKPFRIDRITYGIKTWSDGSVTITFRFYGTNLSSERTNFSFQASLYGPNNATINCDIARSVDPGESGTYQAIATAYYSSGTYTIVFD